MTDLDRKIAELKGLEIESMEGDSGGVTRLWIRTGPGSPSSEAAAPWSRDDSKALELVDELRGKMSFLLSCCPSGLMWYATFSPVLTGAAALNPPELPTFHGDGLTRPEAICRAWVAAMEWMKEKKG